MLNIALGFDDKFARHGAVCVASLLDNSSSDVHFYIMHEQGRLSDLSKANIESILPQFGNGHRITWLTIDGDKLRSAFTGHWSSVAVFYPLMLPELCPEERILFLDADTMVTSDLTSVYSTDLGGNIMAAVHDFPMEAMYFSGEGADRPLKNGGGLTAREYYYGRLGFTTDELKRYFNSGVMLMDLAMMRAEDFTAKTTAMLAEYKFAYVDQDCLNLYCRGRVMLLPAQYNFMILEEYRRGDFSPEFWAEIEPYITAREKPAIIHLILKPDLFLYKETPLFHDLYWGYIKHTPYKKYARKTSYWSWANISKWMRRLGSKEGRRKLKTTLRGVILNKSK